MKNTSYTDAANMNLRIPARSEFHRYTTEKLSVGDFTTNGCCEGGIKIKKIASAIAWSKITGKNYNVKCSE